MKDNVSKESNEYKLYKFFNAGITPPENPRNKKTNEYSSEPEKTDIKDIEEVQE
jgi:hypothetical protein